MRTTLGCGLRRGGALALAAIGIGLACPQVAFAPPGPKGPKPGPKPRKTPPAGKGVKPTPHPGPKGARGKHAGPQPLHHRGKQVRHVPKHRRYVRRHRYWHPRYVAKPATKTWGYIGYPYYVGGTSYVITPPPVDDSSSSDGSVTVVVPPGSAGETDADAADTYAQMQELVALVHEWRTLNESPTLHERLPSADALSEAHPTVAAIRVENQAFDAVTRVAMGKLARGVSAESELDSARGQLQKLTELAEALPPPREGQGG